MDIFRLAARFAFVVWLALPGSPSAAQELRPVTVAEGLQHPWGLAFLPDGRLLVTERPGRLRIVERDGRVGAPVTGLPPVDAGGQGGLLDVALDPRFAENRLIYLSYSEPAAKGESGNSTAVARGRLEGDRLADLQVVFSQRPKVASSAHFGSRLAFARVSGFRIGEGTARDDVVAPLTHWIPSIAPSGMAFLTSDRYPGWKGNLFVGALRAQLLVRLELDGTRVQREQRLLTSFGERVRDVRQGPDGWLYLLTDSPGGRVIRLEI